MMGVGGGNARAMLGLGRLLEGEDADEDEEQGREWAQPALRLPRACLVRV